MYTCTQQFESTHYCNTTALGISGYNIRPGISIMSKHINKLLDMCRKMSRVIASAVFTSFKKK